MVKAPLLSTLSDQKDRESKQETVEAKTKNNKIIVMAAEPHVLPSSQPPQAIAVVTPTARIQPMNTNINITNNLNAKPTVSIIPNTGIATRHHHIHHIPIATTTTTGPWPIVEPVFHFGPGFEIQTRPYCPTHSQGPQPHEHVVFFHVNPGVSVTFQIGGNREVIRGPVTVPMVSQSGSPPIPMPVQVPPGHVMQQIVDESGTLRHVILSTAQHQQLQGGVQGGVQHHMHGHYITTNGTTPHYFGGLPAGFPVPPPHFHPLPGSHLQPPPQTMPHSPSPPNSNYHKDERTQRQHTKLLRKLDQQKREMSSTLSTPAHSPSPRKVGGEYNGVRRNNVRNGASSVGTSEDGEESSSVPDEEEDFQAIIEQLSTVQSPEVSEITSRSALLQWTVTPNSENVIINSRDLRYEVLLSDRGKEGKYKSIFKGPSLSLRIRDLRPGQEYSVCLQVHLEELQGSASDAVIFTTPPCEPDAPLPPKLLARTKNSLQLRWNIPLDNGSNIIHYLLECDEGKGDGFVEVNKSKGKQYSLTKLQPSRWYNFRLAAVNDCGKSEYSDIIAFSTAGNPPTQPQAPFIQNATSSSLRLAWMRRSQDEEYVLQMADHDSGHGYLPMYTGRDMVYECTGLKRATNFYFRLRTDNEAGISPWSEEISFKTMPERPGRPAKPQIKGNIHATHFKAKWDGPKDRGGADIRFYHLEISSGNGFERIYTGAEPEAVCDHLNPGTTYQIRVRCEGPGGIGIYSEPCTITTEAIAPAAPSLPYLNCPSGPFSAVLAWDKPGYDGGAPILEYEIEIEGGQPTVRRPVYRGKDCLCVVTDLLPGELYFVQLRALNRIGAGPWSEQFNFKAGAAPPETPNLLNVQVQSSNQLTVSWNESHCNGSTVSEYRLESSSTEQNDDCFNISYQGIKNSTELRNLLPFTTYYFRVCASNDAGQSPFSSIVSTKTPPAIPNAPTIDSYEVTATNLKLCWNKPESNGSIILYFNIELNGNEKLISTKKELNEFNLDNLLPETLYKIKIQAVNEIGAGPFSIPIKITTLPLPPKPPKIECSGVGFNFIKLKWGEQLKNKHIDFTRYYLEIFNNRTKEFVNVYNGNSLTYKVNKLHELTNYAFRICAETDYAGTGDFSDEFSFMTCAAPPNSIKAPRVCENLNTNLTVEWQSSKNTFTDSVEYILQLAKRKEQDFKEIYRGPETRYTLENLEIGIEYFLRVCPVRLLTQITDDEDDLTEQLLGVYSQSMRYQIAHNSNDVVDSTNNLSKSLTGNSDLIQNGGVGGVGGGMLVRGGAIKKFLGKLSSIFTARDKLSDQEKAIFYCVFFMIVSGIVAAIVKSFIR